MNKKQKLALEAILDEKLLGVSHGFSKGRKYMEILRKGGSFEEFIIYSE